MEIDGVVSVKRNLCSTGRLVIRKKMQKKKKKETLRTILIIFEIENGLADWVRISINIVFTSL